MALTKQKKDEIVNEVKELLSTSKLTVVAKYQGTPVKALQELRKQAIAGDTHVKVIKNRLVIKALNELDTLKEADKSSLSGMLMYAFNANDEITPAKVIAEFAKSQTNIEFVGAYTIDGKFIDADNVVQLASLPSKEQLRAQLIGTLNAPLSGFVNVLAGNIRGVLNVLNARAKLI